LGPVENPFRFSQIANRSNFPIDTNGLDFAVGPGAVGSQTSGQFALYSNGNNAYQAAIFDRVVANVVPTYWTYNNAAQVTATPIPAALPMFGAALVGLGGLARRRAKKAASV